MRLIIAARLSQVTGQTGLDSQDIISRQWAEANGHTVVDVVPDIKSGTIPPWKRKNLRPWVEDPLLMARYDGVLGSVFDRLSRGDKQCTTDIEQWAVRNNKTLLTTDGLIFPCEGEDGIRWDLAARLAHAEWLRTSKRYRNMQKHLIDNGWLVGRRPFTHQIVGVDCGESPCTCKNDRKSLEVDPDRARIADQMASWYLDGDSFIRIALRLNKRGILTLVGKSWRPTGVADVLFGDSMIGQRRNANGKLILRFDPVISMEKWHRLQEMRKSNVHRRSSMRKEPGMVAGPAFCDKCQGVLHYRVWHKRRKDESIRTFFGYRCDGLPYRPSTCMNLIPADELEQAIEEVFTIVDVYKVADREIIETVLVKGGGPEREIEAIEAELAELDYDDDDFLERQAALLAQRRELRKLPSVPDRVEEHPTGIKVRDFWETLSYKRKRAYILATGVRFYAVGTKTKSGRTLQLRVVGNPERVAGALTSI